MPSLSDLQIEQPPGPAVEDGSPPEQEEGGGGGSMLSRRAENETLWVILLHNLAVFEEALIPQDKDAAFAMYKETDGIELSNVLQENKGWGRVSTIII